MPRENLYFIAVVPPDAIAASITAFKLDFAQNYNSRAALKNMPHITLKAPFKTGAEKHARVLGWFAQLPLPEKPFDVVLKDFGIFDNPKNPVVFVHPVITDALAELQNEIITGFEKAFPDIALHFTEQHFKPHMTIAYRDLAYTEFKKAWAQYAHKTYHAQFKVTMVYLLQHNGTAWQIIAQRALT